MGVNCVTSVEYNYKNILSDQNPFRQATAMDSLKQILGQDVSYWLLPTSPDLDKKKFYYKSILYTQFDNIDIDSLYQIWFVILK